MKILLAFLFASFMTLAVNAQTAALPAHDLAAEAFARKEASDTAELDYTFLDTEHDVTHGGIFPSHHTTVTETIALEGRQYARVVSYDGKPLQGKAQEHEQELYEQAIRERKSTSDVRAQKMGLTQHKTLGLEDRLLSDFDVRIVRDEAVDGRPCRVMVFEPRASVVPAPTSRVTWWVDDATHDVLREDRVLIASEDKLLPGSLFSTHYMPLDGVMLRHDYVGDVSWNEAALKNKRVHVIATHTFSNYRKFRTSVTISPATGATGAAEPPESSGTW